LLGKLVRGSWRYTMRLRVRYNMTNESWMKRGGSTWLSMIHRRAQSAMQQSGQKMP